MTFLVIWLAGDVFNLLGVIMQDLLVTMVKGEKQNVKKKNCVSNNFFFIK